MSRQLKYICNDRKLVCAYVAQRGGAYKRGIDFLISFEEWLDVWTKSGHLTERGNKKGQYVMSRYGDVGPYDINNVFIQTVEQNVIDAQKGRPSTLKGIPTGPNGNTTWVGKKHTLESRKKMSESAKVRKKPVDQSWRNQKRGPYKKKETI